MNFDSEIIMMAEAYKKMYTIENLLRKRICEKMSLKYGVNWYIEGPKQVKIQPFKRSMNNLYYHELIPFISNFKCISSNSKNLVNFLRILIPIRNKIAHHNFLNEDEFDTLNKNFKLIIVLLAS